MEVVKIVKEFLNSLGLTGLAEYVALGLSLAGGGAGILAGLWKLIKIGVQSLKNRKVRRDLHPFFTSAEFKKATQYYVPTKCQSVAPSQEQEPGFTHAFVPREKTIPFFLNQAFKYHQDEFRFYIILADSGMGKTTFMINLYLKYVSQWWGKKFKIKLFPLGFPEIDKELDKIEDKDGENTILLLDAFDEDTEAVKDYKKRMDEILKKTFRFRKVVITCRTQFFPSEEEEPKETGILKYGGDKGVHIFRKMYLSPFDEKDIKKYLGKKFSIFNYKKKQRAHQIVKQSPNLMVRPMLLNYIDDLLKSNRRYEYTCQVYEELINRWIEREAGRLLAIERREIFKKELFNFSRVVAIDIYRNHKLRNGLFIHRDDIELLAQEQKIRLDHMEMKSRSLLNRDAQGQYKFSHKSVLEYFLALEVVQNFYFYKEFSFEGMEQAINFYSDMWGKYTFEFLTHNNLKGKWEVEKPKNEKFKDLSEIKLNELDRIKYLNLEENQLTDISPLKELKKLEYLYLNKNQLTDISPLKELKNLRELVLDNNQFTDINSLRELKNLRRLDLNNNQITDISPLKGLKNLKNLYLGNNQLTDISPLKELRNLEILELYNNQLTDISPLKELRNLEILELYNNRLTDISPLKELEILRRLYIEGNPVPENQIKALKKALPLCDFDPNIFV